MSRIEVIRKELIEELKEIQDKIEAVNNNQMTRLEKYVAGQNAAYYRTGQQLINMGCSAIEEAQTWLKDIK